MPAWAGDAGDAAPAAGDTGARLPADGDRAAGESTAGESTAAALLAKPGALSGDAGARGAGKGLSSTGTRTRAPGDIPGGVPGAGGRPPMGATAPLRRASRSKVNMQDDSF